MIGPGTGKALVVALSLLTGQAQTPSKNLLAHSTLIRADKVQNPARITDGTLPTDGDVWNSEFTAILGVGGVAEWDLGAVHTIAAARISADNNEPYFVEVSEDQQTWVPLWKADEVEGAGMRTRQIAPIEARARYVRLHAEGGDQAYSVGELELYESAADLEATAPKRVAPKPPDPGQNSNSCTWGMVVAGIVGLFLFLRRKPAEEPAAAPPPADEKKEEEPKKD